jgi:hypothetical protein
MPSTRMSAAAYATALEHVRRVCFDGSTVTMTKAGTKDEFGTPLTTVTVDLLAHPIRTSPFDVDVAQKVSWSENVDIIFYVAQKQVTTLGHTVETLKKYEYIIYNGIKYERRYVESYMKFGKGWLYILIGGKR